MNHKHFDSMAFVSSAPAQLFRVVSFNPRFDALE
jgi:hypothetical protein